jgi:ornithine cyclodeaminase/alanine dehydrogenase-like protein (mu-crystallin family)
MNAKTPRSHNPMTLLINNAEVAKVLTMETTMAAHDESYLALAAREAVCRPRIDIRIPTRDPAKNYQWGTMEGGSTAGYFAIRMKSDVIYETRYNGSTTQEKYCTRPGLYCGLILLTSIETGEPLAFINDGYLQHMRVGADGGIGVKYLAKTDAEVVGMLGSGGMARTHMRAFTRVRNIKKLQVYSPTQENREKFGREMAQTYNIEVVVCDKPDDVYKGADIVAGLTDSAVPVLNGTLLAQGAHVINVGGSGKPDEETLRRVDVYLRFGDTPAPVGRPELAVDDEHLGFEACPDRPQFGDGRRARRRHGTALPAKRVTLAELASGKAKGRTAAAQITYSERGNLQGAQFFAVAGKVYEAAKRAGLGREIPTEWFLQDIRD